MVFSLALRLLRNREVAEEIAQDVFLACYRQMGNLAGPEHVTSWLRRTVCHRSIDELRRRRFRPGVGLEDAPEPSIAPATQDTFASDRLRRLVAALPEKARMIVTLRYQEDLTPAEISELLDIPVSTVKSHLHRSLTLLRGRLVPVPAKAVETCL